MPLRGHEHVMPGTRFDSLTNQAFAHPPAIDHGLFIQTVHIDTMILLGDLDGRKLDVQIRWFLGSLFSVMQMRNRSLT